MFEELKRYTGLADDDSSGPPAGGGPEDTGGGPEDEADEAPPRYCHRPPSPLLKRTVKITVGGVLLCLGVVMFVTPGPALIVIPLALGILASEIPWLRRHLHALRVRIHEYRMRRRRERRAARERRKS